MRHVKDVIRRNVEGLVSVIVVRRSRIVKEVRNESCSNDGKLNVLNVLEKPIMYGRLILDGVRLRNSIFISKIGLSAIIVGLVGSGRGS